MADYAKSACTTPAGGRATPSSSSHSGSPVKKAFAYTFNKKSLAFTPTKEAIRFEGRKDIAIVHESKVVKSLGHPGYKKKLPQRDPIIQDNNEATVQFKPSIRLLSAEKTTAQANTQQEAFSRSKMRGEFNETYNPRADDDKPQGKKTFTAARPVSQHENTRRISKGVRSQSAARRNPLIDGEVNIFKPSLKAVNIESESQIFNDKKFLLPGQRGQSPSRNNVLRSTLPIGDIDYGALNGVKTERLSTSSPSRPLTALEMKMRGQIKGAIEYEAAPTYKHQEVSDKCNMIKFSEILKGADHERIFARKNTLG